MNSKALQALKERITHTEQVAALLRPILDAFLNSQHGNSYIYDNPMSPGGDGSCYCEFHTDGRNIEDTPWEQMSIEIFPHGRVDIKASRGTGQVRSSDPKTELSMQFHRNEPPEEIAARILSACMSEEVGYMLDERLKDYLSERLTLEQSPDVASEFVPD